MEDLQERTFRFAVRVVRLCKFLDESSRISRTLSRQLLRSGTSIGAMSKMDMPATALQTLLRTIASQSGPGSCCNLGLLEAFHSVGVVNWLFDIHSVSRHTDRLLACDPTETER